MKALRRVHVGTPTGNFEDKILSRYNDSCMNTSCTTPYWSAEPPPYVSVTPTLNELTCELIVRGSDMHSQAVSEYM
jgi:hypothetical protein